MTGVQTCALPICFPVTIIAPVSQSRYFFQAGMGVVAKSVVASEMQEIHNKLAALRRALEVAENLA